MSDIYWSYACLNALKTNSINMFEYGLIHISDEIRKMRLMNIKNKVLDKDDDVMKVLLKVPSVPVIVA